MFPKSYKPSNSRRDDILLAAKGHYRHYTPQDKRTDQAELLRLIVAYHQMMLVEHMPYRDVAYVVLHDTLGLILKDMTQARQIEVITEFMLEVDPASFFNTVSLRTELKGTMGPYPKPYLTVLLDHLAGKLSGLAVHDGETKLIDMSAVIDEDLAEFIQCWYDEQAVSKEEANASDT